MLAVRAEVQEIVSAVVQRAKPSRRGSSGMMTWYYTDGLRGLSLRAAALLAVEVVLVALSINTNRKINDRSFRCFGEVLSTFSGII